MFGVSWPLPTACLPMLSTIQHVSIFRNESMRELLSFFQFNLTFNTLEPSTGTQPYDYISIIIGNAYDYKEVKTESVVMTYN